MYKTKNTPIRKSNNIRLVKNEIKYYNKLFSKVFDSLNESTKSDSKILHRREEIDYPVIFNYNNIIEIIKISLYKWANKYDQNKIWKTYTIHIPKEIKLEQNYRSHKNINLSDTEMKKIGIVIDNIIDYTKDEHMSLRLYTLNIESNLILEISSDKLKMKFKVLFEISKSKKK